MNTATSNNLATESWAIADLLCGDFKQSQYGRITIERPLRKSYDADLDAVSAEMMKLLQVGHS